MWVANVTPRSLYPRERPGKLCVGGWVGPRADLEGCGKSRLHRDSIPRPSRTSKVAIPTGVPRPTDIKYVFWFSLKILSETFLILGRIERDVIINVQSVQASALLSYQILVKPEFAVQIFEKYSDIVFTANFFRCEPSCSLRTDRQKKMTKLIGAVAVWQNHQKLKFHL